VRLRSGNLSVHTPIAEGPKPDPSMALRQE
jgi:hypothetical protein